MTKSIEQFEEIDTKLNSLVNLNPMIIDENLAFSISFARIFAADSPNYQLKDGNFGATRSNWTYHTAFAIAQTAKIFNLICKFECDGKRDAVIQTNDDVPETRLFAEWEWDYNDVFGPGKELDKLRNSCVSNDSAGAFLLVYCPYPSYPAYLQNLWMLSSVDADEIQTCSSFDFFRVIRG